VIHPAPVTLERNGVRLEPMSPEHAPGMEAAAADGELWKLWFTSVPDPGGMPKYIDDALKGMRAGHMLPWVVRDLASGAIVGSTRYHDIIAAVDRVEIGWTWYSASRHRTHINTTCKLLLLAHAFTACDRSARRKEGRRDPSPLAPSRRHRARLSSVQHPRNGVAGCATAPGDASRETRAWLISVATAPCVRCRYFRADRQPAQRL
jgi:RimJ/RimL family protein N-acetyltransferase